MTIHVYHHSDQETKVLLRWILERLERTGKEIMLDLTKLQSAVAADTAVDTSAKTLIEQIAAELKANAGNQAAVDAIADQLLANSGTLSAAVAANTVAAPPAP